MSHQLLTVAQKELIAFYYDHGYEADDIAERSGWDIEAIQAAIDEWVQACDDTERPFEPGDMEG